MGVKLHHVSKEPDGGGDRYAFFCPGCRCGHFFVVPRWTWNGSLEKPTVSPSLLVNATDPKSRCHSFVTDGRIHFLNDCHHDMKGSIVEIPDWEDYW